MQSEQAGGWWPACGYSLGSARGDVELGEENKSMCESVLLAKERDGETWSRWCAILFVACAL